ncbi:MAG: LPS export ABC transporter periplasmic protein LptC [Micavibrio sp.]
MTPEEDAQTTTERLAHLQRTRRISARLHQRYSRFVKIMRLVLPLIALALLTVVMAWPKMEKTITPMTIEDISPAEQAASRNELINPRFEGVDSGKNPYTLTATRAVQSQQNPDILLLDAPTGTIIMKKGEKLDIDARKGTYRQMAGNLLLDGAVNLKHSNGYVMDTEKLAIDIKTQQSRTDQPVTITGPAATLNATGMDANNETGLVVFTGPAKLILKERVKGL